jgi:hypothetical protein
MRCVETELYVGIFRGRCGIDKYVLNNFSRWLPLNTS